MEILRLLDRSERIKTYEVSDFRQWQGGFYYRMKIVFSDKSVLFAREYADETERDYSFHWQDDSNKLIRRWDNAPHHSDISTFHHHKHTACGIVESTEISLQEVLKTIQDMIYISVSAD